MNINKDGLKKFIWLAPAIAAFLLALIPTLKYQWPLSWDVIYHVVLADVYAKYGLVFTNPLINVPYGGSIGYPPLFHLLIAALGILFKTDFFQITRFLQPFLVMFLVLSVTYVGRKFYGTIAGISAGFLVISSLILGTRLIYPLPENLALIFLTLSIYCYYYSITEKSFKYAILAGFLFMITLLTHQAVPIVLFLVITAFTLVELFLYRDIQVIKNYGAFLLLPVLLLAVGVAVLSASYPDVFNNILNNGNMEINQIILSNSLNQPINMLSYGKLGILTGIFALIGAVFALKRRQKKDIFIFTWIILVFLLINANLLGVNILSFRLLTYILIPVSILGGFGLSQVYYKLKDYKRFSSQNFRTTFLISMLALATFSGVIVMENPQIAYNNIENQYGTLQITPTDSMVDLANWFDKNGNKNKSILTNNPYVGTFITAKTSMPLSGDDFGEFTSSPSLKQYFKEIGIGYVVLDKRLSFQATNGTFYRVKYDGAMYPLFYYSGDIHSNLDEILPNFATVVYENKDFIVLSIQ
jgi:4-amino-4-deoxy-L-arabinose transferase-like glycosyltransferase